MIWRFQVWRFEGIASEGKRKRIFLFYEFLKITLLPFFQALVPVPSFKLSSTKVPRHPRTSPSPRTSGSESGRVPSIMGCCSSDPNEVAAAPTPSASPGNERVDRLQLPRLMRSETFGEHIRVENLVPRRR